MVTGLGILLATLFQPGALLMEVTIVIFPKPVEGIPPNFLTYQTTLKGTK